MATVNLSWSAPATGGAPVTYNLYRTGSVTASAPASMSNDAVKEADVGADGSGTPTAVISEANGVLPTTYSDSASVSSGYTYFYTIAGENTGGEGALSNVATAVVS